MTDQDITNADVTDAGAAARRFAVIYADCRSRVYAFAVSKAGRQLAEEILSEVFMIAWRRLGDVPEPPLPWLLAVTRNVAMSQSRALARERSLSVEMGEWVADARSSAGDIADDVTERIAVLSALATLAEPDRELLTLVTWHGLSPKAAAQVIGCSTAAYFVRLHRARRRLEAALAAAGSGADPAFGGRAGSRASRSRRETGTSAMKQRRTPVLALLASARSARLDADAGQEAGWPVAAQLIKAASLAQDPPRGGLARDVTHGKPGRLRRPLVPVKLLGALASATVTAVVIVIAVVVGTVVLRAPHGQPTGAPSTSRSPSTLVFSALPLGPHWHGHLAYAMSYGVVYLTGTATLDSQGSQPGQSGPVATLPGPARPAGRIDLAAVVGGGAGAIEIGADGRIKVIPQQPNSMSVSLGGVSFQAGSR